MDHRLTITVNDQEIPIKEYQGQRVITFREIDAVHERRDGTARKRFNDNRKHFIEGVDYFKVTASEFRTAFGGMDTRQQTDVTLITESGYLMLVKSFTDDLAWDVQRQLVSVYFRQSGLTGRQRTAPTVSPAALAKLIRVTRDIMIDMGSNPVEIGAMAVCVLETWNIPVPAALANQIPGQLYLFTGDAPLLSDAP